MTPFPILAQTTAPTVAPTVPTDAPAPTAPTSPTAPVVAPTATTAQPSDQPFFVRFLKDGSLMPLVLAILVLYIFVFRSKRKQDAKKRDEMKALTRGAKVQTIGGILGTVVEAKDDEVVLKVDETSNTKIRFTRNAIHRVLEDKSDK